MRVIVWALEWIQFFIGQAFVGFGCLFLIIGKSIADFEIAEKLGVKPWEE